MRYIILLLLWLNAFSILAQTNDDTYSLSWRKITIFSPDKSKIECLSFDNASLSPESNWLPVFSLQKNIYNSNKNFAVTLVDTEFSALSSTEKQILQKKSFLNRIEVHSRKAATRRNTLLTVNFIPIRVNPTTKQLEKLIHFKLKFTPISQLKTKKNTQKYATNSVLSSGKWIKIAIDTTAIHKITFSDLKNMGFQNPKNIRVYGFGGEMLPKMNNQANNDDLPLVPIYMHAGTDGVFNNGDYILFYAKGTRNWKYSNGKFVHQNHQYANKAYYFLTDSKGKSPMVALKSTPNSFNQQVTSFDAFRAIDNDKINLLESGQLWLSDKFDVTTSYNYNFKFHNLEQTSPIKITTSLVARSATDSYFLLTSDSKTIGRIDIPKVNTSSFTASYAAIKEQEFNNFYASNNQFKLTLSFERPTPSAKGWLNFINVNARCKLQFTNSQMAFRDTKSVGTGNISKFTITNCNSKTVVWDISDMHKVEQQELSINGNIGSFTTTTNTLKEFVVFDINGNFPQPKKVADIANQNLHAITQTDMLIVTPKQFAGYANKIADYHRKNDNISVTVATQTDIFNEFSSGTPDVAAIRNFVRMLYKRPYDNSKRIKYLLLFGDGSYDNKLVSENNTNKILTYQSENSLSPTLSFVSDDFYGLLDENEGETEGLLDIGIGRLPVNNNSEAQIVTNKIVNYATEKAGNWRTKICFIGDDEDNNTHVRDANTLAEKVSTEAPQFLVKRIFLDDYPQTTSSAGQAYPEVNQAINQAVNNGCLIVNYTGHGNEKGLAHEHVVTIDDIQSWQNSKLPLFVTASCEFSRFDNYRILSAGEMILLRNNGGGIGLLTTTRLVYSSPNFVLNKNFYTELFKTDMQHNYYCIGDILRKTKNATASGINKRNFTLLGDPAIRLNMPKNSASTLLLNNVDISKKTDTLKAMSTIKITGEVKQKNGSLLNNFNGTIYPTVFDKSTQKSTRGNDGTPFTYREQKNVIYKGKASVNNGKFNFSFFVPKDINYKYGNGKIHYYAASNNTDAAGFSNNIIVGGTNPNATKDNIGPEIKLFLNNEQFTSGETTNNHPLLLAILNDITGINTIGTAIGHNLTAILDNSNKPIELNDSYQADINSYQKGKVKYQFANLKNGEHTLKLKAWDNMNNSSEEEISFVVADNSDLAITHLLNYPNPFTTKTAFYFEQNQGRTELDIIIQILTISGKLIKTIETTVTPTGNRVGPIAWDGKDDYGNNIGRGVYFYRVKVRTPNGKTVNKFQKLVILK